ncbi:DUF4355 domain-containing protein [Lactococcus lactis]|uniref:DUF4355 domain-containing protein n=1 Tax=Lactococcus lactis TaxID=1358 RepID=UPI0003465E91|nr:DUF4355 domain-containing protein [Lactococcus lactis]KST95831.1 Phage capsid and scaffold [Lactococcus lactis subsp. lactis]MDU0396842.1 hypothetical protein [Lactococcus lactis]QOK49804.1 DUF4355 domain-containing protein [Lactococcus lactis]
MKHKQLLPLNLQHFAEGRPGEVPGGQETPAEFSADNLTEEQLSVIKEKFGFKDDTDVDNIVKSRRSRWQQELDAQKAEAEKLAKMNADEKAEHERKKLKEQLAEYKRQDDLREMSKVASEMLKEEQVRSTDDVLKFLVSEDADQTKAAVKTFVEYMKETRKLWEVERNTGVTPKIVSGNVRAGSTSQIAQSQQELNQFRITK